jgi:hypothetical protein
MRLNRGMGRPTTEPPYEPVTRVHRELGHPVRVASGGRQAYCVVCLLLWSQRGEWYATDIIEQLAA